MTTAEKTVLREEIRHLDGDTYSYTLSAGEGRHVACFGLTLYSVTVRMTTKDGKETACTLEEIFADEKHAMCFFEKIVKNYATPIDLPYVLEDEIRYN